MVEESLTRVILLLGLTTHVRRGKPGAPQAH